MIGAGRFLTRLNTTSTVQGKELTEPDLGFNKH